MLALALLYLCAASPLAPLAKRDSSFIGEGLGSVPIDAPGLAYPESWKGFPNTAEGGNEVEFVSAELASIVVPGLLPHGLNPSSCTPKEGEYPVVLIPGTSETPYANWAYIGPKLVDEGYCVYTFAHNPMMFLNNETIVGATAFMGDIKENAQALSSVIDYVLELTGASQVDTVGHSQGAGALPFYYFKNIMSGNKVRKHVGLAPSLGTSFYGINELFHHVLSQNEQVAVENIGDADLNVESLLQQLTESDFMKELHSGGLAVEGVEYVNIATQYDDVLLPYTNCLFNEDNRTITNIVLQDVCAIDFSDHIGLGYSNTAYQIVLNQLKGEDNFVFCELQLPVFNR